MKSEADKLEEWERLAVETSRLVDEFKEIAEMVSTIGVSLLIIDAIEEADGNE